MPDELTAKRSKRLLDPIDRISEVLFGLIMALTFTCSISAAEAGREDVRTLLIGALGCNIAWGLIDAVIYLLVNLTERARSIAMLKALQGDRGRQLARNIIADALPPVLAATLSHDELDRIRERLEKVTEPPQRPKLGKDDYLGAIGVFLLVFLATFPVVIPFMVTRDAGTALRVSNAIALVMLFLAGFSFGKYAHYRPYLMGLMMTFIGAALVVITIALGG
jgi:VIT1/CCC1 family predicted Fe2+/Mn2+ transporter